MGAANGGAWKVKEGAGTVKDASPLLPFPEQALLAEPAFMLPAAGQGCGSGIAPRQVHNVKRRVTKLPPPGGGPQP